MMKFHPTPDVLNRPDNGPVGTLPSAAPLLDVAIDLGAELASYLRLIGAKPGAFEAGLVPALSNFSLHLGRLLEHSKVPGVPCRELLSFSLATNELCATITEYQGHYAPSDSPELRERLRWPSGNPRSEEEARRWFAKELALRARLVGAVEWFNSEATALSLVAQEWVGYFTTSTTAPATQETKPQLRLTSEE